MKSIVKIFVMATALVCSNAFAIKASTEPVPGSQVGVAYLRPNDNHIYGQNFDKGMHPASTLKVLTGLSAILYLGHDYTFKTNLGVNAGSIDASGKLKVDSTGTLQGDVLVKFVGDPSFTSKSYRTLIQTLTKAGVKRITGDLIIDVSRFSGLSRGEGWSWNDIPICFTAPAGAAIINRNCVFAQLKNNGVGQIATPIISSGSPISIHSDAIVVPPTQYGGNCELEADLFMRNEYHITGCVPSQEKGKPWPLSLSVSDTDQWAVDWTAIILNEQKIAYRNIKVAHSAQSGFQTIGTIESAHLDELVKYMLYRSNNLYADAIAKTVAAEFYNLPATYSRTTRAARAILNQYANINLGNSYLVDGSGLSSHNIISPQKMLEILEFINLNDSKIDFIRLLPVADESGTLHWRASTKNPPLAKNVQAKTGTLQNVSNLMGFMKTKSGVRIPFVVYTNSITYDQKTQDLVKYHRIASPHLGYERYVLEQIYDEKIMGTDF